MVGKAEIACGAGGGLLGHVGDGVQLEPVGQVKDLLCRGEAEDMGLAHEAGADQADAKNGFVRHVRNPD
ncbi:hypothetical protein SDC9_25597 [bioreactor metagenome]|uniref:Uncharacterized protein n=1 Tax=bioreactor metagenome TaxID=1076179 RepID=A0A644ULW6_9ZZZZ